MILKRGKSGRHCTPLVVWQRGSPAGLSQLNKCQLLSSRGSPFLTRPLPQTSTFYCYIVPEDALLPILKINKEDFIIIKDLLEDSFNLRTCMVIF